MSKDKNTNTDAISDFVVGLNNIVSTEVSVKEVVIFHAKCLALFALVMLAGLVLFSIFDSFIAKAAVFIITLLFIKGILFVVWLKDIEVTSRGVMSYIRGAANSKDKERQ